MEHEGCKLGEGIINNMKCLTLENELIRLTVIPECGAKITSFVYKPTDHDFLWHNPEKTPSKPIFGSQFLDSNGFDECIPTIAECRWKGKKIPDHGDVWSLPWSYMIRERTKECISIEMQVKGITFPFTMHRKITLKENESKIKLNYIVHNEGKEDLQLLWSAHPTLAANSYMKILLPPEVDQASLYLSLNNRLRGKILGWPFTKDFRGQETDLSIVPKCGEGGNDKLFTPKLSEGWCAVLNTSRKELLGYSFPVEKIPFVGIWLNSGGWLGHYCIGLEPTTSPTDLLDEAVKSKECLNIRSSESISWHLNMTASIVSGAFKGITKSGEIMQ